MFYISFFVFQALVPPFGSGQLNLDSTGSDMESDCQTRNAEAEDYQINR